MNTLRQRQLRNLWIPWVATMVLACFSNAGAQASYRVTDLGTEGTVNLGCAMSVNNQGWTEVMAQNLTAGQQDNIFGQLLSGRAFIDVGGFKTDLGTLGGSNTSMNWGQINDVGQVVGFSETSVADPNGEDVCGFGTHVKCLPFLWQSSVMSALPTLGGNNGEASGINNHGQIVGFAETAAVDSGCSPNLIRSPVMWKNGKPQALPTVDKDPDGMANGINDQGQIVGFTGTCGAALHAVSWEGNTVTALPDFGTGAIAQFINGPGQIAGIVGSADNTTQYGALWQNGELTSLGLLPGDFGGLASGINNRGQIVGSNFDSNFSWSHGFLWENGVMIDLNTLIPASANLYVTMANEINERGQISGMAIVISGPDAGNIHAFLASPARQSLGRSVADVVHTRPTSSASADRESANLSQQRSPRFGLIHFAR